MADPLRRQVRADTRLRYGQSLADLLSARHTNYHQYQNDVNNASDVAKATKQAAKQAVPALKAIYDDADRARADAQHQIALTLSGSGSSSALAMALQGESALTGQRTAAERAMAQADAVQRGTDATAGLAYAKKNALENFRSTRGDLMAQTRQVHSQMGEFATSRLADLQSAQAEADRQDRNFTASNFGYDPVTGQPTLQGRKTIAELTGKDPLTGKPIPGKGPRGRTKAEDAQVRKDTAAARDEINKARTWIQRLRQGGNKPASIVSLLKTGGSIPVPTGQTDARGQAKVREVPVPAIGTDFLRAAMELDGGYSLSKHSVHVLRSIHNVHVPEEWLPKKVTFGPPQKILYDPVRR